MRRFVRLKFLGGARNGVAQQVNGHLFERAELFIADRTTEPNLLAAIFGSCACLVGLVLDDRRVLTAIRITEERILRLMHRTFRAAVLRALLFEGSIQRSTLAPSCHAAFAYSLATRLVLLLQTMNLVLDASLAALGALHSFSLPVVLTDRLRV